MAARLNVGIERLLETPAYQAIYGKWHGEAPPFWTLTRLGLTLGATLLLAVLGMAWWRQRSMASFRAAQTRARTERAKAEEFQAIVDAAPDAMVLVNPAGKIELVNAQVEALFGYGRDELVGQDVEQLIALDWGFAANVSR